MHSQTRIRIDRMIGHVVQTSVIFVLIIGHKQKTCLTARIEPFSMMNIPRAEKPIELPHRRFENR